MADGSAHMFERFSTRDGFNQSLGHFRQTTSLVSDIEDSYNLADSLNEALADKEITQSQLLPIINAVLADKYGYYTFSSNLSKSIDDFTFIKKEVLSWDAVDMVLSYHHPDLGLVLINPKNPSHWDSVNSLRKNELAVLYVGAFTESLDMKTAKMASDRLFSYLEGGKAKGPQSLKSGSCGYEPPEEEEEDVTPQEQGADKATTGGGKRRMTPLYSVPVTNELFHNGNVEAWKRIIESYKNKNPSLDVYIFYDNERIQDIAALFKWGKVKHGSAILFAVAGEEIRDVAKLQRYLRQGASPQFETFLKFPVNKVLNLF